jgi:hypothetical protein
MNTARFRVLVVPIAMAVVLFGCVSQPEVPAPQRGMQADVSAPEFLVFRVGHGAKSNHQRILTTTFLYPFDGTPCTVDQVLSRGLYFRNLQRAVAYVQSLPVPGELIYDSMEFVTGDKNGMLGSYMPDMHMHSTHVSGQPPDMITNQEQWDEFREAARQGVYYLGPLPGQSGGFVFRVEAAEGWETHEGDLLAQAWYLPDINAPFRKDCNLALEFDWPKRVFGS